MSVCDINDIASEAGVIASVILKPEFSFYSEQLTPHHFTNAQNGYLYYAVSELAKRDVRRVDAYNIMNVLSRGLSPSGAKNAEKVLSIGAIEDFIENAPSIARTTMAEYMLLVDNVLNAAFRRDIYNELAKCQQYCLNSNEKEIEQRVYSALDSIMMEYSTAAEVPQYKDVVDELWAEIRERQDNGMAGVPFKFPALNNYATIEPGELFIFAAEAKQGKSMMLLNEAVDLMRRGLAVMYIDSELNSRMFTCRLIAHLAGIEFSRVKSGRYTDEEGERINQALKWLHEQRFTHLYMPMFDAQSIYTSVKKVRHTQGLDVLIVDY